MKKTVLLVFAICLFLAATVFAEPLFDQIYFKTRTTKILPGTYTLRFSIWSDVKKGEMVWSEEQMITTTDNTIEAILGYVTPLPDIDYSLPWYVQVDLVLLHRTSKLFSVQSIMFLISAAEMKECCRSVIRSSSLLW